MKPGDIGVTPGYGYIVCVTLHGFRVHCWYCEVDDVFAFYDEAQQFLITHSEMCHSQKPAAEQMQPQTWAY